MTSFPFSSVDISVSRWPTTFGPLEISIKKVTLELDASLHNLVWTLLVTMIVFFALMSGLCALLIASHLRGRLLPRVQQPLLPSSSNQSE